MTILQVCFLLLGGLAITSFGFPTITKDARKLIEPTNDALEEIYVGPTQLREPKDLAALFSYLKDSRGMKSLSIVGRDNNFIYLLVSDSEGGPSEDEEDATAVGGTRSKRSLFKKLGKGYDLIGPTAVRNIAVTISLFNYLGYLPMRLPGVPYHIDTGSPDYTIYNTVNEFPY